MQSTQEESALTMHEPVLGTLTVHFTDGKTQCFEFDVPEIDPRTSASKIEQILVREQLVIHLSDRVLLIPMQSIKCMEFKPAPRLPPDLSAFMIRNARPKAVNQP